MRRVERVTEYRLATDRDGRRGPLSAQELLGLAGLLHDRMTESVFYARDDAPSCSTNSPASRRSASTCWAQGRAALVAANRDFGLALSDDEIDYLVDAVPRRSSATRPTSS